MSQIKIKDLNKYAGGLNIEGGFPYRDLTKNQQTNKLWVNLILVLDRPIIDNITFDEILKNNKYPLLENFFKDINEHNFIALFTGVILYYAYCGSKLVNKDKFKITVHVHQDVTCIPLVKILEYYLNNSMFYFKINKDNIAIDWRTDHPTYVNSKTDKNYDDTDILISLSQCAGLEPSYKPGDILIPDSFIPYNIYSNTVDNSKKYQVPNHINKSLNTILCSTLLEHVIMSVNANYMSYNKGKENHQADIDVIKKNIYTSNILHVDDLWNPLNGDELVTICGQT
jgi:hypothetical protein